MEPKIGPREDQLAEIWRVAVARRNGQTKEKLADIAGPLSPGSLDFGLGILKAMFKGKAYLPTMPPSDTEFFLNRIDQELAPDILHLALSSLSQHLKNYAYTNGPQVSVREVCDRWLSKSHAVTSLPALESAFSAAVAHSLTLDTGARAKQSSGYPETPTKRLTTITTYDRNPHVVAQALLRANGICANCKSPAPFPKRSDNTPYLEVHHIDRLADGGKDRLDNVQALCPNCHRKAHHG